MGVNRRAFVGYTTLSRGLRQVYSPCYVTPVPPQRRQHASRRINNFSHTTYRIRTYESPVSASLGLLLSEINVKKISIEV